MIILKQILRTDLKTSILYKSVMSLPYPQLITQNLTVIILLNFKKLGYLFQAQLNVYNEVLMPYCTATINNKYNSAEMINHRQCLNTLIYQLL